MTKNELIEALKVFKDDKVVICKNEDGGWDNIVRIDSDENTVNIIFGGGSPFSDE